LLRIGLYVRREPADSLEQPRDEPLHVIPPLNLTEPVERLDRFPSVVAALLERLDLAPEGMDRFVAGRDLQLAEQRAGTAQAVLQERLQVLVAVQVIRQVLEQQIEVGIDFRLAALGLRRAAFA